MGFYPWQLIYEALYVQGIIFAAPGFKILEYQLILFNITPMLLLTVLELDFSQVAKAYFKVCEKFGCHFLNQARAWFLKIEPVQIVCMCVCVCLCVCVCVRAPRGY